MRWLVAQGVSADLRDKDGASALHYAAAGGRARVIRWLLLERGVRAVAPPPPRDAAGAGAAAGGGDDDDDEDEASGGGDDVGAPGGDDELAGSLLDAQARREPHCAARRAAPRAARASRDLHA